MSKYGAKRVKADGYSFDSLMEARRYQQLKIMQLVGVIHSLEVHPRYEILPAHIHPITGRKVRAIYYEADFRYVVTESGATIVEDVKGAQTAVFKLKRKLVEHKHEIEIVLVEQA